ncbi:MAG: DNA primase [Pseudomonadota bacterium]
MARLKDSSVEAVKAAADIVPLVEARTRLRKVGSRYTGLCPFHDERTPSFSVSPDRGTYHCFGCGVGGDAIRFVQETEGLDFVGAIEWLADRFDVPLEYEEASPQADADRRRLERLRSLLEQTASFYERFLWESPRGEGARAYLGSRGLGEPACREFRLGLSPENGEVGAKARARGYTQAELVAAGLVTRRGTDYFRGRLMFPLADGRGRVIGFQARKLREDDPLRGKYVNSPESDLFRKSHVLYGLHLARAAVAKQDRAIVVEGNTDVIALRQAGLEPVVASMGTALTERQLRELSRLTKRLFLCFDADAAGEDATLRGMELALAQGFDVRIVSLPQGTDPADDPTGFEAHLAGAEPYAVHRVRLELARARDRQHAYVRVQDVLNGIPESPERHEAWRVANDKLGLTVQLQSGARTLAGGPVSPRLLGASERLERSALAGVRAHPSLERVLAELGRDHFDGELHRRAVDHLLAPADADAELNALLAELDARAAEEAIDEATAEQLLLRLRERKLKRELETAGEDRLPDLQQALAKVRTRFREFA